MKRRLLPGAMLLLLACGNCLAGEPFREFLRGDSNDDGRVDISDMVGQLNALFLGAREPDCLDRADLNDDGRFDVSDPVYGLSYLFRGGAVPAPPGPLVPGFDPTPDDPFACGDPPPVDGDCQGVTRSDLAGVSLELPIEGCELTLAQVAEGSVFRFRVVVEAAIDAVVTGPTDAGQCQRRHASGFHFRMMIEGNRQRYCLCDTGHCRPPDIESVRIEPGVYSLDYEWSGHNWSGPSDTVNPLGAPFPAGEYAMTVEANGEVLDENGEARSFRLHATTGIVLLD